MNLSRGRSRRIWLIGMACLCLLPKVSAAPRVDFNREVRPLLSDTCFACHGPDTNKIKGGLRLDLRETATLPAKSGSVAIVPGHPETSELVRRIATTEADDLMPPAESHKHLTEAQKDLLRRWIAEGAEYRGHWSYVPPTRPPVPAGSAAIDHLVRARLTSYGLTPAAEADRRTLLRRLHFDLTGLPPSPEEITAFELDASPDAYERRVDQLLASPRFGERMAIGWLDVVRFADTIGYHSDTPRNVWPYRDYVIRSFNRNKPFDQFTREQLAGDLLPDSTLEQRVASGFNRLLLTTEEGGAQPKDYEARYLTDRVRAVSAIWLGQTLGCAQCHDHKFDPITARDFYSMGAFFADVGETIVGAREPGLLIPDEDQAPVLAGHERVVNELQREFDGPHPELTDTFASWQQEQLAILTDDTRWMPWSPTLATSAEGATLKIRDDRSVLASGMNPDRDTYVLRFTNAATRLAGLQIEVLPDDSLPAKGPGRADNGNFVLTKVSARVESAAGEARPIPFSSARATHEQTSPAASNPNGRFSAASLVDANPGGAGTGWAILPAVGQSQRLRLSLSPTPTVAAGETLVIELQQHHGQRHTLGRFRMSYTSDPEAAETPPRRLPPAEIAAILRQSAESRDDGQRQKLFASFKQQTPELASLREQLATAQKAKTGFESTLPRCLVTVRSDQPRVVRILPRGNWLIETGDEVAPALPGYLTSPRSAPDRRLTRLDLADWIVSPENPLTSRVVANRLWRQFFGIGLSKVLDDFGAQGEPPSHPELLDWLACEFRDSGWDMKHLVRLMVLSATYRQDSRASQDLLARDPDNRLLARQGRWRVEAELVRDQALTVAGLLVSEVGGPSARPYQPAGYWENLNFPVRTYEASGGKDQYRRGLYSWWQRSYVHPSMLAFDAPTREECAAERSRSNIPQQALVLLNDPSYVEAARAFAARLLREAPGDDEARLTWAWRQMVGRVPTIDELATTRSLLDKHRTEFQQDPAAAVRLARIGASPAPSDLDSATLAAWINVARVLLNLHETITRS